MDSIYLILAFWFLSAVISTILAYWLKISIALMEVCVGAIIGYAAVKSGSFDRLALQSDWMRMLAGVGAILLTFLAGAELNPQSLQSKLKEVTLVGLIGFFAPFFGCTLIAYFLIGWTLHQSLLCGIALSTTSMVVVYAVMLEYGFNKTDYGKGILGSYFINDLGTVWGLGLIFALFYFKNSYLYSDHCRIDFYFTEINGFSGQAFRL